MPAALRVDFAPGAGNRAGGVARAAAQIEIIAVARAVDIELKLVLLLQHVIGRSALDLLVLAIGQIDGPGAGPVPR